MKFSNLYIFTFASIMVITVAALLSFSAIKLKPSQDNNIKNEKMKDLLTSVQVAANDNNAQELFKKYIVDSYVMNTKAEKLTDKEAFVVDMGKEFVKIQKIDALRTSTKEAKESPFKKWLSGFIDSKEVDNSKIEEEISELEKERELPVYVCNKNDSVFYIIPMSGKGLWGPIWGYIALLEDMNTIYGVKFDHKGETPGLGAEINEHWFQDMFQGKKIRNEQGDFVSVKVVKGGTDDSNMYGVDAISGGTITSKGLEDMIFSNLNSYLNFLEVK